MVWCCFVAEDVHEQCPTRPEPRADAPHELSVVLHVLKHLNRHDTVVRAGRLQADSRVASVTTVGRMKVCSVCRKERVLPHINMQASQQTGGPPDAPTA
jgi:hypothetical protein